MTTRSKTPERPHTMEIPDWVWEWAQAASNRPNPASFLRTQLQKWIAAEGKGNGSTEPDNPRSRLVEYDMGVDVNVNYEDFEDYDREDAAFWAAKLAEDARDDSGDPGHIFRSRIPDICWICSQSSSAGEYIFVRNKRYSHIRCNDRLVAERTRRMALRFQEERP